MRRPSKKIIAYYCIGLAIAIVFMFIFDVFHSPDLATFFKNITDAFTVSGIIVTFLGLLNFAINTGLFDMTSFSTKRLFSRNEEIISGSFQEAFAFYREKKEEERASSSSKPILIAGCTFLMIALIFLCCYYMTL